MAARARRCSRGARPRHGGRAPHRPHLLSLSPAPACSTWPAAPATSAATSRARSDRPGWCGHRRIRDHAPPRGRGHPQGRTGERGYVRGDAQELPFLDAASTPCAASRHSTCSRTDARADRMTGCHPGGRIAIFTPPAPTMPVRTARRCSRFAARTARRGREVVDALEARGSRTRASESRVSRIRGRSPGLGCRKHRSQVLRSDPNVRVRSLATWLYELDVYELVPELVERDVGRNLRSLRGAWTRFGDHTQAAWREDECPRTETRTGHECVGKQDCGQGEGNHCGCDKRNPAGLPACSLDSGPQRMRPMARTHAPNATRPITCPGNRRSANRPVATPLTIVTNRAARSGCPPAAAIATPSFDDPNPAARQRRTRDVDVHGARQADCIGTRPTKALEIFVWLQRSYT